MQQDFLNILDMLLIVLNGIEKRQYDDDVAKRAAAFNRTKWN